MQGKSAEGDSGYGIFSVRNLHGLRERGIEGYVPDANLSYELKGRGKGQGMGKSKHIRDPEHRRMRQKLRSAEGQRIYQKRKSTVEPVFGVLKQQRGLRQFRLRGLQQVAIELTLAATAYNLTRMYNSVP
jgi:Transposase DDE domain